MINGGGLKTTGISRKDVQEYNDRKTITITIQKWAAMQNHIYIHMMGQEIARIKTITVECHKVVVSVDR